MTKVVGSEGETVRLVLISRIDWFWMVPLVLSLVQLIVALHFTGRLRDEAREKYLGI